MNKVVVCRFCNSRELDMVVDLGNLHMTGVFPYPEDAEVPTGLLQIYLCSVCGLAQLGESFDPGFLYGKNYGYRSGLNRQMNQHLHQLVKQALEFVSLDPGDTVLDIGSNDGTLLRGYSQLGVRKIGIDPTASKFAKFYDSESLVIPEFFSAAAFYSKSSERAKVITSIAMLYDLEDPKKFAEDIKKVLHPEGIWITEQSYAPWMLRSGSFDTICHEHLEYYSLSNLDQLCASTGLKVISTSTNEINGGSLRAIITHEESNVRSDSTMSQLLLKMELEEGVTQADTWINFSLRLHRRMEVLSDFLESLKRKGYGLAALGASTKGNVLLQLIPGVGSLISEIGEINPDKFGRITPGTRIPIIPQAQVLESRPDYLLILPWHFRNTIVQDLELYSASRVKLIFPLPNLEVVEL